MPFPGVSGVTVSMFAFQVVDPGSTSGRCILLQWMVLSHIHAPMKWQIYH